MTLDFRPCGRKIAIRDPCENSCTDIYRTLKAPLLTVKFSKFCSESFYRDNDRRAVFKFRKICPTRNRRNRALLTGDKRTKILHGSPAVATARIAPKICQGQLPTMYSECYRFNTNRFTFGRVRAERVKNTKSVIRSEIHTAIRPI